MSDVEAGRSPTRFYIKLTLGWLLAVVTWVVIVFFTAFYGWWMQPVALPGDSNQFFKYASERLNAENPGNSALAMVTDGQVSGQHFSSADQNKQINSNTVFATASMSKLFAAYGVMALVQDGRLDLDAPVTNYLTRWTLPENGFDNNGVTVRRLLSHTAGFQDGLGFGDYRADEPLPSLESSLNNVRSSSGESVEIAASLPPGSEWHYSGGSYLLLELIVEEVTGQAFKDYMQEAVFTPLGMNRSGYEYLGSYPNNSGSIDQTGEATAPFQYASNAATAFVTSTNDLLAFVGALIPDATSDAPLSEETIKSMREPHGQTAGINIWGLGNILYAPTASNDHVFGHDGANDPAINTALRVNPETNDAIVVMVTGHPSLATNIGSEWVLWQTGMPDVLDSGSVIKSMYAPIGVGSVALVMIFIGIGYRRRGKR